MDEVKLSEILDLQALLRLLRNGERKLIKPSGDCGSTRCNVEELAAAHAPKEPTIFHHLAKLKELDLLQMQLETNSHFYCLNLETLNTVNKAVPTAEPIAT